MVDFEQEFLYDEGPPVNLVGLQISLNNYAKKAECIYIGITGDIDKRSKAHSARFKRRAKDPDPTQGWNRMVAIYNTTDHNDAQQIEKSLIKWLRSHPRHAHKCLNKTMGGELLDQYEHYFIYLLLGPKPVRQVYWGA